jgi:hypothetical protein
MRPRVLLTENLGRCLNRYWYVAPVLLSNPTYFAVQTNAGFLWIDTETGEILAEDIDSSD